MSEPTTPSAVERGSEKRRLMASSSLGHSGVGSGLGSVMLRATPTTLAFDNIHYTIPPPRGIAGFLARRRARKAQGEHYLRDEESGLHSKKSASSRPTNYASPADVAMQHATQGKPILKGLSGVVLPGQLVAIMGSSGAGKTTLLDILAGRDKAGILKGTITVNGKPRDNDFQRLAGYVTQDDCLLPLLTVFETLMFYANVKLPSHVTHEERVNKVNALIDDLGLEKVRNSRIGSQFQRGISGGEKKRVSIGCELITDPSILFLDEPTTGLDSYNSLTVMEKLHTLARRGHSIVCTIHQPRSSIFAQFDQLMLMSEGSIVYYGDAKQAANHMSDLGFYIKPYVNPADFLLDVVIENEDRRKDKQDRREISEAARSYSVTPHPVRRRKKTSKREGKGSDHDSSSEDEEGRPKVRSLAMSKDYQRAAAADQHVNMAAAYAESVHYQKQQSLLKEVNEGSAAGNDTFSFSAWIKRGSYARSWLYQVWILAKRGAKTVGRNPMTTYIAWFQTCFMALLVGSIYWDLGLGQRSIQDRLGALFFITTNQAFSNFGIINAFMAERPNFNREREGGCYSTSAYFFAKNLIETPVSVIFPITLTCVVYFMCGFQLDIDRFFIFLCDLVVFSATAASLLLFLGALSPNLIVASILAPISTVLLLLFGGFYINGANIPVYYIWIKYISFFKYGFEILVKNEMTGLKFTCDADQRIGGQCPVQTGEQQLEMLDMQDVNIWDNVAILGGMIVAYRLLAYLCLRYLHKEKR